MDVAHLGEKGALPQLINDDVDHFGAYGLEEVPEQVVGHGSGRLDLLQLQCNGLRLKRTDDDRQATVTLDLAEYQCVGSTARWARRKTDDVDLYEIH